MAWCSCDDLIFVCKSTSSSCPLLPLSPSTSARVCPPQAFSPEISALASFPDTEKHRPVRIYQPPKNTMQSGTRSVCTLDTRDIHISSGEAHPPWWVRYTRKWCLQWNNEERWENPLMGWASRYGPIFACFFPGEEFCDLLRNIAFALGRRESS